MVKKPANDNAAVDKLGQELHDGVVRLIKPIAKMIEGHQGRIEDLEARPTFDPKVLPDLLGSVGKKFRELTTETAAEIAMELGRKS